MKLNKRLLIGMPALVLGLASCGEAPPPKPETAAPAANVSTVTVARQAWASTHEAVGTVRARAETVVVSRVMAYVREVKVRAGDRVQGGQPLVLLDARDQDAALLQAQAALQEARSAISEADSGAAAAQAQMQLAQVTFKRMEDLFQKKSISHQEFDEASARLKMAQSNHAMALSKRRQLDEKIRQAEQGVKSAENMRGYAEIRAPFAGIVTARTVEPGTLATPGMPLLTLEQEGNYRFEAQVEESRLLSVRLGQPVEVRLDALERSLEARVAEIVPAVDAASRAFLVKLDLPRVPGLRSGVFGRAVFSEGTQEVLTVPAGAVRVQGQLRSVLVAEGSVARSRLLTAGREREGQVEVLSGLNPGERVIFPLPEKLTDGARVEVRP